MVVLRPGNGHHPITHKKCVYRPQSLQIIRARLCSDGFSVKHPTKPNARYDARQDAEEEQYTYEKTPLRVIHLTLMFPTQAPAIVRGGRQLVDALIKDSLVLIDEGLQIINIFMQPDNVV